MYCGIAIVHVSPLPSATSFGPNCWPGVYNYSFDFDVGKSCVRAWVCACVRACVALCSMVPSVSCLLCFVCCVVALCLVETTGEGRHISPSQPSGN